MFARSYEPEAEPYEYDDVVFLRDVSWDDYKALLAMRGERSIPRITYLDGQIELMSPSQQHESLKSWIGRLVEVWCLEHGINFWITGSWTVRRKPKEAGVEADESYIFGDDQHVKKPHLAIEIFLTSGRIDKLEVYRRLGVREVWIWQKGRIQPYVLRGKQHVPVTQSEVLPGIDLDQLLSFLDRPSSAVAIRDYRAALVAARGSAP